MLYCENWEEIKKRYIQYWARENHDLPILCITAPKDVKTARPVSEHKTLRERWMDVDYNIALANWEMQNTLYLADAFPAYNPNLGPDFFATAYGAEITFGEDTSWAQHVLDDDDVEEYDGLIYAPDNEYYEKMLELTHAAVEDGKDKYLVGVTDLHPGSDGVVSLRGPQELCYDMIDNPDFLERCSYDMLPGLKDIYEKLYNITTKYQTGSTCWMKLWHPGRWYVVSSDFSCMISEEDYNEKIAPEIEEETRFFDASVYHLDGPGALRHLDRILQMPDLNGVQWVYGAGQPTASHWIDVIRKIQDAGKTCYIDVMPDELEILLKELPPEGLFYNVNCTSETQARELVEMAEKYRRAFV